MSNYEIPKRIDDVIYQLKNYYKLENSNLLELIENSRYELIEKVAEGYVIAGYYQVGHRLIFYIDNELYSKVKSSINSICERFLKDIQQFLEFANHEIIYEIKIVLNNNALNMNNKINQKDNNGLIADTDLISIWKEPDNFRLFLSHVSKFKKETAKLKENLSKFGITSFVAHDDIEPSKEWQGEIEKALFSADSLLCLITDDFHNSVWTNQEIGFALGRGIPVYSLRLGEDPKGFLGAKQAATIDLDSNYDEIFRLLLKKERKMVDIFIEQIKISDSYERSNTLASYLKSLEIITDKQVQNLLDSFNSNSQVYQSMGMNGFKNNRIVYPFGFGLPYELKRLTGKEYEIIQEEGKNQIRRKYNVQSGI